MNKRLIILAGIAFTLLAISTSCVSVAEYQKMYLNDRDMELSDKPIEGFESGFETYREGPSGGNGSKAGGGCGCN